MPEPPDRPPTDPPSDPPTESAWTEASSQPAAASERIGPYRLLEKLGEGGMGEVWLAEQSEPVRRRVALKVIKRGMNTREVIARFEAERQALAMMEHPAIAKVFDAGATPRGRPYFVMEHVRGLPITEHCDRQRLTTRERLRLFQEVCEGVQHAHHKAVIHRDLKPSNVLVSIRDGRAEPTVIDFGVAKATGQQLTDTTMHTRLGTMIGTPEYMSPEQADLTGQDIDTRTDVYALGVMLYEILVGALPFDPEQLRRAGFEAIVRTIRDEDPPKPSTRLTTLGEEATASAEQRRTDVAALRRELSGDLDWIVMKALEKERSRRYDSPHELAADIGRYLADEPVTARPPSATYRAGKFVRRHTAGVVTAVAGVALLIAFAVTMAVQTRRTAAERDRAERAAADLEAAVEFQAEMLSEVDTEGVGQRLLADLEGRVRKAAQEQGVSEAEAAAAFADVVRNVNATNAALRLIDEEILARAAETLGDRFSEQPLIEARLRFTLGSTYRDLGLYAAAESQYQRGLELRRSILGHDHPDTLAAIHLLGRLHVNQARYDEAEPLLSEALDGRQRVLGPDDPATVQSQYSLGILYRRMGRLDEAEAMLLQGLAGREGLFGREHPSTLEVAVSLGQLYDRQGRYTEAEALHASNLEMSRRMLGDDDPRTLNTMNDLALAHYRLGRFEQAGRLWNEALATQRRVLGDDHPNTVSSMNNLAGLAMETGRFGEAERLWLAATAIKERVLGPEHRSTIMSVHNLGELHVAQGRLEEARERLSEALARGREPLGARHWLTLQSQYFLAEVDRLQGRLTAAERLHQQTLTARRETLGADHPATLTSIGGLAEVYRDQGRDDEAADLWREVLDTRSRVLGADHRDTAVAASRLARIRRDAGQYDEAEALFQRADRILAATLPAEHPLVSDNRSEWEELRRLAADAR